jgi:pimeloyl-ACP methyl ester carboxylesterase
MSGIQKRSEALWGESTLDSIHGYFIKELACEGKIMMSSKTMLLLAAILFIALPAHAGHSKSAPQDDRVFPPLKLPFLPPLLPPEQQPKISVEGVDREGAIYRYEVPQNWNGDLVMYAHGFRGCIADPATGALVPLYVDNPPLREYYLLQGYAWAASSYSKNCYDVKDGVESTNRLARIFARKVGTPNRTLITGFSMGGHITGAAIEMFPNVRCPEGRRGHICRRFVHILGKLSGGVAYDGAAPACGVMGDVELFNYFGDFATAAGALAAAVNPLVQQQFPPPPPAEFFSTTLPLLIGTLFSDLGAGYPDKLTAQGEKLKQLTRQMSGGERPLFDDAYPFWQDLLFGLAGSDGTLDGVLPGNIYDNRRRVYQFDGDPILTPDEQELNHSIIRVKRDRGVNRKRFLRLQRVPEISGRIDIPVLSIHTTGDLFVPFSMEQIYARDVANRHRSNLLVSRATRAIDHCEFSAEELIRTFDDLVLWVEKGIKPAGDDILDPEKVADSHFGCQFTEGVVYNEESGEGTPEALRSGVCSSAP